MSVIAGVWHRTGAGAVDRDLAQLTAIMGVEDAWRWSSDGFGVVGVDSGLRSGHAPHVDSDGAASAVVGQLLLDTSENAPEGGDVGLIHREWRRANWDVTELTRGVFAGVHWDPANRRLALISDSLAIRPLYYWFDRETVAFASCLWMLERFTRVPKVMDVIAVGQMASFGYPLGDRTPYVGVRRNEPAKTVVFTPDSHHAHRWELPRVTVKPGEEVEALAEAFDAAVRDRLRGSKDAAAFLSGGMDSRAVVGSLLKAGVTVHTYNFGWERSQDYAFATAFARAAGTQHTHRAWEVGAQARASATMAAALAEAGKATDTQVVDAVWSGDGGSCGLGWIYISQQMVDYLRKGQVRQALQVYFNDHGTNPRPVLARGLRDSLAMDPINHLTEAYESDDAEDPVRRWHHHLLRNDQRRHVLHDHFESQLSHRLEFHLPFFDPRLRSVVEATSTERLLFHRLYSEWWEKLPKVVRSVPWQTYPGHVPCPVPAAGDYEYQWETNYVPPHTKQAKREQLEEVHNILFSSDFPGEILSRPRVLAAYAATRSGWRDYSYLLSVAALFGRYWLKSGGRYVAP